MQISQGTPRQRQQTYIATWRLRQISRYLADDCMLNSLPVPTTQKAYEFHVTGPLWGESTGDQWIPSGDSNGERGSTPMFLKPNTQLKPTRRIASGGFYYQIQIVKWSITRPGNDSSAEYIPSISCWRFLKLYKCIVKSYRDSLLITQSFLNAWVFELHCTMTFSSVFFIINIVDILLRYQNVKLYFQNNLQTLLFWQNDCFPIEDCMKCVHQSLIDNNIVLVQAWPV